MRDGNGGGEGNVGDSFLDCDALVLKRLRSRAHMTKWKWVEMGVYDIIVTLWHFKNNFFKFITIFFLKLDVA